MENTPITDPNEVLLNPEYLNKLREEEKRKKLQADQDAVKDYVDEWSLDPLNGIESDFLRNLVDYLATPMPYDPDKRPMSVTEEETPVEWKVEIPLVNVTF